MGGLLQNALTRFAGAHPEITYELLVAGTDDVMRAVAEDRCEIGIAFYPQPRPEIEALLRLPAPLLAVMAPDHRLAEHRFLALGDLAAEPVALPTARFGIRHLLDHIVKTHNVELAVRLETNSVDMLRQFAICGLGITFLPAFGIERELRAGTLVAVPLEREIVSPSTLQVVKRSEAELSPPAGRFVNILSEVAGGLG
jgi:DNA-binding transcriptional LysR family regulator